MLSRGLEGWVFILATASIAMDSALSTASFGLCYGLLVFHKMVSAVTSESSFHVVGPEVAAVAVWTVKKYIFFLFMETIICTMVFSTVLVYFRADICYLVISDEELRDVSIDALAYHFPALGFWISIHYFLKSITIFLHRGKDALYSILPFIVFGYPTIYYSVIQTKDGVDGLTIGLVFALTCSCVLLLILLLFVYKWQRLVEGIVEKQHQNELRIKQETMSYGTVIEDKKVRKKNNNNLEV